jgi:hypothetical protein
MMRRFEVVAPPAAAQLIKSTAVGTAIIASFGDVPIGDDLEEELLSEML